jgi:hypothetical protein
VVRKCAGLLLIAALASAAPPKLFVQSTDHLEVIYYSPAHEYLVAHLIRAFENAYAFESNLFHYTPSGKVTILLQDFGDHGHGAAGTVPRNLISIGLAPFSYTYETIPASERMAWVTNHELIHIVMGDNASESDRRWRKIFFGKVAPNADDPLSMFYSSLTSPRHYSPRWFHEGIAAFMETWMAGGLGRALGGYDEMVFRAMVRDDTYIYQAVGLESEGSTVDFQTGANAYLYGTRFMTYLALTHGPERLLQWITRGDGTHRYFSTQFTKVFGAPLNEEWVRWIAYERKWQTANLKKIEQYPVTKPEHLTRGALGSVSRPYYDPSNRTVYAAVRYPGRMAHIAALHLDSGQIDHLKDLKGSALYYVASICLDPSGQRIFFTTDNNNWRDLNVYDLKTRHARKLLQDFRTGDLAWNAKDGSLWGIRHNDGLSSIVRLQEPFDKFETLHEFPYGTDLFDIDISPDGQFLTGALGSMSGKQKLVRYRLDSLSLEKAEEEGLYDFEYNSPGNFVHSPDGRYLYGSSYYTGVSNLFRYDTQTRNMDVISNAETGLFRPLPLPEGELIAFEYTARGFVPSRVPTVALQDVSAIRYLGQELVEKYPVLKTWKLPPPSSIDPQTLITHTGSYSPFRNVRLISAYPIVQGYLDSVAGGYRAEFADRLRVAGLNLTASVSPYPSLPTNQWFHGGLEAYYWDWKLTGYYNNADFYDLFGPTKVSRKGGALKLDKHQSLLYDSPRTLDLDWNIAGYVGMDRLPDYQNVTAPHSQFVQGNISLKYSFLERSLGAVDDEKGTTWKIASRLTYAGNSAFPRLYVNYDRGWLLPLKNSSFWIRGSGGKSWGNTADAFGNYYFGGFGNNWIDHLASDRYRDYYTFPGVQINQIGASNYVKALGEWDLPPIKFKRLGTTAMYVNWARFAAFSSVLATNFIGTAGRTTYANLGVQLDVRIVLFTYLNTTFSAGYAGAMDQNGQTSNGYMISLKIL